MKIKIKNLILIWLVVIGPISLSAQQKEPLDSIKTGSEKKVKILYGEQYLDRFVGNMNVVKGEALLNYPAMMVQEALAGQLPGLFMMQVNGNPGEDNFTSFIRGNLSGTITLVDGVERSLTPYDLGQIEEIRILKDPVSKALYGGRISNGIIMVTTKRGKSQVNSKFHTNIQRGVKLPTSLPEYLSAFDFATSYNKALANDNITSGVYQQDALDAYQNHSKPYQYPDVDYYGQFLNNSMNLTKINGDYYGGNSDTKFYVHAGYQREGGFEAYGDKNRQIQAFNIQSNLDSKFSDGILLHANFFAFAGILRYPGRYLDNNLFTTLSSRYPNAYPILVANDSAGGTSSYKDNPYSGQVQSGYVLENTQRMQTDLGFDFKLNKIINGLTLRPNFSFDIYRSQNLTKIHTPGIFSISAFDTEGKPLAYNTIQQEIKATGQSMGAAQYDRRTSFTNTLNYQHESGKHFIDADLVFYLSLYAVAGTLQDYKRQNLGLRLNYNYAGKYSLEGVLNYCGSQSYAPDKQFKAFPAIGAGWLISKEDFLKDFTFLDFLKINASWGIMGDGNIPVFMYRETWWSSTPYSFNTSAISPTTAMSNSYNPDLNWPKQREIDISLEAVMLQRLGWKFTYFDYLLSGTLSRGSNTVPLILGGPSFTPFTNFGETGLKGIEAQLSYSGTISEFKYRISTHFTRSISKMIIVDELPDPLYTIKGRPMDEIRGFTAIGTYTQAEIDQIVAGTTSMALPSYMDPKELKEGNIIYKDKNNDGILDKYDYEPIGNNSPRLMYGGNIELRYKGFELYALLLGYGEYKHSLNSSYYQIYSTRKYSAVVVNGLPNGNPHPRLTTGTATNDLRSSDYWTVKGGYLKLRNVSFSYSLPQRFISVLKMSDMKVSLNGTNLLTFSKIKDSDPESMSAGLDAYPLFRTFAIGISGTF